MIKGENIICIGGGNWNDIWRNRQQIMYVLSKHNRIFYVNPIPSLTETLHNFLSLLTFKYDFRIIEILNENLYIFRPPIFLFRYDRLKFIFKLSKFLRNILLRQQLKKYGFKFPILWLARPDEGEVIDIFNEKLLCYHIVDEYASYLNLTESEFRAMETNIAKKADIVITSSKPLLERKKHLNPNIHLVINAVDYNYFEKRLKKGEPMPEDILRIPKPIICYLGAINQKVDLDLLLHTAKRKTNYSLVLIGPVMSLTFSHDDFSLYNKLKRMNNVYFLGTKKKEDVPLYYKSIDVGILPYKLTLQGMNIFPLKMFELLACGKPVVSVEIPSVKEYSHVVDIASNRDEFFDLIEKNLKDDPPEKATIRRKVASENTWDKRVETISIVIEETLKKIKNNRGFNFKKQE